MIEVKHMSWWMILAFIPLVAVIGLLPWIHSRWPSLLPMTGPLVTLYEDKIACLSGKSQIYIALDNIAECRVSQQSDKEGGYSVLSFTPKNSAFGGKVIGVLTETAVSDSAVTEQVIAYLRDQGIIITEAKNRTHTSP